MASQQELATNDLYKKQNILLIKHNIMIDQICKLLRNTKFMIQFLLMSQIEMVRLIYLLFLTQSYNSYVQQLLNFSMHRIIIMLLKISFITWLQIILMKKQSIHDSLILPTLTQTRAQPKPIKDILKDLKQRKMQIQERLKTQTEESEHHQKDQVQANIRSRIITQVPYYNPRKSTDRNNLSTQLPEHYNYSSMSKVHDPLEEPSERSYNNVSQIHKKNPIILQPITIKQRHNQRQSFIKQISPPKSRKQLRKQIQQILIDVPIEPKDRTQANITQLKQYLEANNMFFAKIESILTICLLKLNKLVWVDKREQIYRMGEEKHAFYIILCGRVKLYNTQLKLKRICKICNPGETVGQQLVFMSGSKKFVYESAKAMSRCLLVEIKTQNFKKLNEEMIKFGYKICFQQMESIIKRNFITKNWLRSERARLQQKN